MGNEIRFCEEVHYILRDSLLHSRGWSGRGTDGRCAGLLTTLEHILDVSAHALGFEGAHAVEFVGESEQEIRG